MKMLGNRSGYNLIELTVASALLAVSSLAIFQTITQLSKSGKQEEQRAKQYVVLIEIVKNLEADDSWIPPQPADTSFSTPAHANRIIKRCYNEDGIKMEGLKDFTQPSCYFKVQAFKTALRDRNYPLISNPMGDLPISQYSIQVRFPYLGGAEKTVNLSTVKTNYARY